MSPVAIRAPCNFILNFYFRIMFYRVVQQLLPRSNAEGGKLKPVLVDSVHLELGVTYSAHSSHDTLEEADAGASMALEDGPSDSASCPADSQDEGEGHSSAGGPSGSDSSTSEEASDSAGSSSSSSTASSADDGPGGSEPAPACRLVDSRSFSWGDRFRFTYRTGLPPMWQVTCYLHTDGAAKCTKTVTVAPGGEDGLVLRKLKMWCLTAPAAGTKAEHVGPRGLVPGVHYDADDAAAVTDAELDRRLEYLPQM